METALLILIFGWIKYDLEVIKRDFKTCPRHGHKGIEL